MRPGKAPIVEYLAYNYLNPNVIAREKGHLAIPLRGRLCNRFECSTPNNHLAMCLHLRGEVRGACAKNDGEVILPCWD